MILLFLFLIFILISVMSSILYEEFLSKISNSILITIIVLTIIQIFSHCHELSIIKMSDEIIKVQQDSIHETDRQMKELSESVPTNVLMNQDSPYRSLIEMRRERINSMTKIKQDIVDAKRNILQRKLGIFSFIVSWFGDK